MFVLRLSVSVLKLVEVVGVRWIVGWCFAESKSLVGLDRYGVQSYFGWYKYITFACLAHALLVVFSSCSLGVKTIVRCDPSFCGSLFGFKRKRGLYV